jgi:hypothetical protein
MMSDAQVEWLRLRTFNGSQDAAFEELCKQLLGAECRVAGGSWIPKGKIDAGVEGYGVMPNGDEWGLQAKWFLTSPGPQQWSQVDESVRVALERHPRLKRYVVCMPTDLSDARTPDTTSARERWEERRMKYVQWAADRKMNAIFEYRGSHELVLDLTAVPNRGMRSYWFGGPEFSPDSVKHRIEDILSAVGPRYSKKLNVEVPLSRFVDAMTLSERFIGRIFEHYRAIRKWTTALNSDVVRTCWPAQSNDLSAACGRLCGLLEPLAVDNDAPTDWNAVAALSRDASRECRTLTRGIRTAGEAVEASAAASSGAERNPYEHQLYELWKLSSALQTLQEFADGPETRLSRAPYMLLVGEAGSGKTHFLCDVAVRAADAGNIAILALGSEEFGGNSVWGEIARRNGLPSHHEELLGALQSAAEATQTRALVLIDGINEGPSTKYWQRELSVLINQVRRYPRVALVVSVRDTFLDACVREDAKKQFIEVVHKGFAYDILEAQRIFFKNFDIREPSVPLLLPEFANPLFLTLFCKGIVAAGLCEVPRGLSGLTAIFNFFVDAQNLKISEELDVDPAEHLVHRALDALAEALTPQRPNTLDRTEAKAIVDGVHSSSQFSRSLFGALEREGLISTMRFGDTSYVRFTYERMADHARARRLLEQIAEDATELEYLAARIGGLLAEAGEGFGSTGLFEALSMQVPERYGHELLKLLAGPCYRWQVEALLRALPWRQPESVSEVTAAYVFGLLEQAADLREEVVECLLSCALVPRNPLNAAGLHDYLRTLELPRRDTLWTIPISGRQHDGSAVMRMTSWAREGAFGLGGDDAAEAAAVALLWLCTSTNRRIRDDATKGVVAILDSAPSIATALYERFCQVDDPYVVQRLYAALAGHAMRTPRHTEALGHLAQAVLHRAQGVGLPVDILARDYARTIIEKALALGALGADVDVGAVRPPYGASPPEPTEADSSFFQQYEWQPSGEGSTSKEAPRALRHLHSSLGPHGDFSRYVVGTNSRGEWLTSRLSEDPPLTSNERRNGFVASLSFAQARLHKAMLAARRAASDEIVFVFRRALEQAVEDDALDLAEQSDTPVLDHAGLGQEGAAQDLADEAEHRFVASLDEEQQRTFEGLEAKHTKSDRFDLTLATHWMFRRILDMGYGGDAVYTFDERVAREAWGSGEADRPATIERIGKKYQWIAYFEFLARMADNYYLESRVSDGVAVRYDVPAQILSRDIDPSLLVVETKRPSYDPHPQSGGRDHLTPIGASTLASTSGCGTHGIFRTPGAPWSSQIPKATNGSASTHT